MIKRIFAGRNTIVLFSFYYFPSMFTKKQILSTFPIDSINQFIIDNKLGDKICGNSAAKKRKFVYDLLCEKAYCFGNTLRVYDDDVLRSFQTEDLERLIRLIRKDYNSKIPVKEGSRADKIERIQKFYRDKITLDRLDDETLNFPPPNHVPGRRRIRLGLCCIVKQLNNYNITSSHNVVLKTVESKGIDHLKSVVMTNLRHTLKCVKWCILNDVHVFRMSSKLFPQYSNPKLTREGDKFAYDLDFAKGLLAEIGQTAKRAGIRLTFHPDHFNILCAKDPDVLKRTITDLEYHADVLDLMGCTEESVMVIHGGATYGDKAAAIERWCSEYEKLPQKIRKYLALENCERNFSIEDCLEVSRKCGVRIVYDVHHYDVYCKMHPEEEFEPVRHYIPEVFATWGDVRPKMHISQQDPDKKLGAHSYLIDRIPDYLFEVREPYDLMIEAKGKEQAIKFLKEQHPEFFAK